MAQEYGKFLFFNKSRSAHHFQCILDKTIQDWLYELNDYYLKVLFSDICTIYLSLLTTEKRQQITAT